MNHFQSYKSARSALLLVDYDSNGIQISTTPVSNASSRPKTVLSMVRNLPNPPVPDMRNSAELWESFLHFFLNNIQYVVYITTSPLLSHLVLWVTLPSSYGGWLWLHLYPHSHRPFLSIWHHFSKYFHLPSLCSWWPWNGLILVHKCPCIARCSPGLCSRTFTLHQLHVPFRLHYPSPGL